MFTRIWFFHLRAVTGLMSSACSGWFCFATIATCLQIILRILIGQLFIGFVLIGHDEQIAENRVQ